MQLQPATNNVRTFEPNMPLPFSSPSLRNCQRRASSRWLFIAILKQRRTNTKSYRIRRDRHRYQSRRRTPLIHITSPSHLPRSRIAHWINARLVALHGGSLLSLTKIMTLLSQTLAYLRTIFDLVRKTSIPALTPTHLRNVPSYCQLFQLPSVIVAGHNNGATDPDSIK